MPSPEEEIQLKAYDDPTDNSAYGEGPMQEILLQLRQETTLFWLKKLGFSQGIRVLDAGTGQGHIVAAVSEEGFTGFGLDLCPNRIVNTSKETHINRYVVGRVQKMPFEDRAFKVVTAFEIWEHLSKEGMEQFFTEIWRVLDDDGVLILSTQNSKDAAGRLFGWLKKITGRQFAPSREDHPNETGYQEMHDLFSVEGLEILDHSGIGIIPGLWHIQKCLPKWLIHLNINTGKEKHVSPYAPAQLLLVRKRPR